ncbi:SHOCT domain-containing protein [Mycobacterium sp. 1081908.1]|uniref:SHOCT domain-containing protein n=1 Tax=Mycobacterium sp. 1081908.1 TaxID=1834066 RepID=UPI0008013DBF|nr:SHOCT domain-containing protein [Mycobacterium sp. 1081908.1]OBK52682.1 hypothetical protein A5655_21210 [Mycobacterium sp. 1081908.1]
MKALSEEELLINQQAASVAATVVPEAVVAATRFEQVTDAMTAEAVGVGAVTRWGMRVSRKMSRAMPAMTNVGGMAKYMEMAGLPDSFILAVTAARVYALEDKRNGGQLVPGNVLKVWDRGFRASFGTPQMQRSMGVPDDRQMLILFLPIEGGGNRYLSAAARNNPGAGFPHKFMVARDAPSQRVIDELRPTTPTVITGGKITGGMAGGAPFAPPQPSAAQRLQELEALRASGVISDAEYAAKREKIIGEI